MGTPWRGLLALENSATADGRRFKTLTWRDLPLGLKWQRVEQMGHDTSVVVGSVETMNLGTTAEAIEAGWISEAKARESGLADDVRGLWGSGQMLDDVDPAAMPRLAEDVAEAMELLNTGVIAPSIDAIAQGAIMMVEPGEDEPPSEERWDQLMDEFMETGIEPPLEMLFEEGLVAAATLVVTPAFSEVRPFELVAPEGGDDEAAPEETVDQAAATQRAMALTAAAPPRPAADLFVDPQFAEYTGIHTVELPNGMLAVRGHFADAGVCHAGIRDECRTPPLSAMDYVPFHRNVIELDDGTMLGVGRITAGFGRVGNSCPPGHKCRGKDDHACEELSLAGAIAHHDLLTSLAWVRAGVDANGRQWVAGVADVGLSAEGRRLLNLPADPRRGLPAGWNFSGDWRDYGGDLELVELLCLTEASMPAFAPRQYMRDGRRSALIACYAPRVARSAGLGPQDGRRRLAREVADLVVADLQAAGLVAPTDRAGVDMDRLSAAVTAAAPAPTGAVVALAPSEADAARLAVEDGPAAGDLHLPLLHLGDADRYDDATRAAIIGQLWDLAAQAGASVAGEVTSASEVEGLSVLAVRATRLTRCGTSSPPGSPSWSTPPILRRRR